MDVRQKNSEILLQPLFVFQKPLIQRSNPRSVKIQGVDANSISTGLSSGSAPIVATLMDAFLDFSGSKGSDLRKLEV
ncbi:hypothetical protein CC78DRAFT_580655 [Lojkania enalia]|uniref:Uncharacterized protein n=1 Tax=Lojkania enalia TaxID=147567 RepID=A0A9P4N629_9PLEO|nr:hypothetical protein CC78DRAFT_580655 [Didymosphaeria enalia]